MTNSQKHRIQSKKNKLSTSSKVFITIGVVAALLLVASFFRPATPTTSNSPLELEFKTYKAEAIKQIGNNTKNSLNSTIEELNIKQTAVATSNVDGCYKETDTEDVLTVAAEYKICYQRQVFVTGSKQPGKISGKELADKLAAAGWANDISPVKDGLFTATSTKDINGGKVYAEIYAGKIGYGIQNQALQTVPVRQQFGKGAHASQTITEFTQDSQTFDEATTTQKLQSQNDASVVRIGFTVEYFREAYWRK